MGSIGILKNRTKTAKRTLLCGIVAAASTLLFGTSYAAVQDVIWIFRGDNWCLQIDEFAGCSPFPIHIKSFDPAGAELVVKFDTADSNIYVDFRFLSDGNSDVSNLLSPAFIHVESRQVGKVIIDTYEIRVGDKPDSVAQTTTVFFPSLFWMHIGGGTVEAREKLVNSFAALGQGIHKE